MQTATRMFAERGRGGGKKASEASFWRGNRTSKKDEMLESEFDLPVRALLSHHRVPRKTVKLHHAMQASTRPKKSIMHGRSALTCMYLPKRRSYITERAKLFSQFIFKSGSFLQNPNDSLYL